MFSSDYDWYVGNSAYEFDYPVECEFNGLRTYYKSNSLRALGGLAKISHGGSAYYTGPVFVSTTPQAIIYYTSYQSSSFFPTLIYSFEYLGVTWYIGEDGYFWENQNPVDDLGNMQSISDTVFDRSVASLTLLGKALIDIAQVVVDSPSPTVYIPADYQQVEYIDTSSSGRSGINTGVSGNFTCELDMYFNGNGYRQLMGVSLDNTEYIGINSSGNLEMGGMYPSSTIDGTVRNTIVYCHGSNSHSLQVNGAYVSSAWPQHDASTPFKIFTAVSDCSAYLNLGRIYRCKIIKDSGVVRDMYPVYRKSDNKAGLFDIVNEVFYPSMMDDFTAGPDVVPVITGRQLVMYANKLWEPIHEYTYTGSPNQFTLQPGQYLIECNGASGGRWGGNIIPRGGTSYGVLTLQSEATMYAVVGGNGGNSSASGSPPGTGGYNGGGDGGITTSSYDNGPGGGGASDVRLTMQDESVQLTLSVPAEYDELEYLRSDSNSSYNPQYINTGYVPKSNTKIEMKFIGHSPSNSYSACYGTREYYSNNFTFFFRSEGNDYSLYEYNNSKVTSQGTSFPLDTEVKLIADGPIATVYDTNDQVILSITTTDPRFNPMYPMMIFTVNQDNYPTGDYSNMSFIEMKVYEGNNLVHYYVPISDVGDPTSNPGLFDIVEQEAFYNQGGGTFIGGTAKTTKTEVTVTKILPTSLLSRFIVAGGAGGSSRLGYTYPDQFSQLTAFGGGVNGGYPDCSSDGNYGRYASQTGGYSFGIGMTGPTRTSASSYSAEGSGGGGGGWYGGYSNADTGNISYTSGNGGGGSGYVLTDSSYKPTNYFHGFTNRLSEFYLSNTFMNSGSAIRASVIIYRLTTSMMADDVITCPATNMVQQFNLPPGKFKLKASGGYGGLRIDQTYDNVALPGYAEGILDNPSSTNIFIRVGGSAILSSQIKPLTYREATFPAMSFNGGGKPHEYDSYEKTAIGAGGASDIRVGTDSLYSRILVAGGGAGPGSRSTNVGGSGGGTSGGTGTGRKDTNEAAGGTQTNTPELDQTFSASCQGGFGFGGSPTDIAGAGGGGWFGGNSGKNSSYEGPGGGGGSGYVLTESSYKPEGYLVGSDYYLTNTRLRSAYTAKAPGYSSVIIECIELTSGFGMLAQDGSGYKSYDAEHSRWVSYTPIGSELAPEDFIDNGIRNFPTDDGLTGTYSILIYDPDDTINTAIFNIVPAPQRINIKHETSDVLQSLRFDYDCDENATEITTDYSVKRNALGNQYIDIDIRVQFIAIPESYPKFYDIVGYTMGSIRPNPVDPIPPSVHNPPIDLLSTKAVKRIPSREKNYIGDTLTGGDTITSVQSSACFIKDRTVYSVTECNNSQFRFARLDLISNRSTIIKDIPKSAFGNICIGDLYVSDTSMYVTTSATNTSNVIYKTSLASDDFEVSTVGLGGGNNISCKGKMRKFDEESFILFSSNGFEKITTVSDTITDYSPISAINTRYDFAIGEDYIIATDTGSNGSVYKYDITNNTWSTVSGFPTIHENSPCCYGDGKFYITEPNYLYILNENDLTYTRIATPYETTVPKTMDYGDGFLYITIANTASVYIYNIARNEFSVVGLSFMPNGATVSTGNYRPCTFDKYFFMGNLKMFVCNIAARAKYNLGYKGDQFVIITNSAGLEIDEYTYDNTYVAFNDACMYLMPGTITKPVITIDIENSIKRVSINKASYGQLSSVVFTKIEESGGGD